MSYAPESIAYHQGEYKPLKECNENIMTHALQYGTMVFGGLRGYYDAESDNVYLFRPEDHMRRLHRSAHIMQMVPPLSESKMVEVALEITRRNNYRCNVYYRPFIYKDALQLSPRLHDVSDDFAMYSLVLDDYLDTSRGMRTVVSSWRRIDENIIPTRAKVSGGYANSALAKSEAVQHGFDEAIFLDSRGFVSEGSAENIFMVRDGVLITPPVAASVLEGITRRSIIELARMEGMTVLERDIARTELYIADELFFCGTGAQVAWIEEVDRRIIADGQIGPITRRLRDRFRQAVIGKDPETRNWVRPVFESRVNA
ncbi:MAG TPA: branched-chain amino acid transaminase [Leptospiraceae bacterium]|nr:branched-chain amino acid transaminase [Leptospiraceae bacterium]